MSLDMEANGSGPPIYGGLSGEECPDPVERETPPLRSLVSRVLHWGPLLALAVVGEIAISTIVCHLQYSPPKESFVGALSLLIFMIWVYLTINNLFTAAQNGPGYVDLGWSPEDPEDWIKVQYCTVCLGYKAPRSHHCRKCNRCVMKMDHHCPWINNCVGHKNQAFFMRFLLFAVCGCLHSLFILGPSIYHAVFKRYYIYYGILPPIDLDLYGLLAAVFGFGLAVGVVLAVGFLFGVQMLSVLRNRTGIEDYILKKANAMRRRKKEKFLYPYDLGRKQNFKQVLTTWSGHPPTDGIWWPVAEGCTQFTLTVEQKRQKERKRANAVEYIVVRQYSGRICTCWHGFKTFCCQPFSDEPRIPLQLGEHYLITRWAKHWLYGEKIEMGKGRLRGWFPRVCVRCTDAVEDDEDSEEEEEQQHQHQD